MEPMQSPLQPRTESPVLTYIHNEYEADFKLPQPLLEQTYSNNHQWEYPQVNPISPFLTPTYDTPQNANNKRPNTPDKKKRDPYSLVISKLVYMFLQHMNTQVSLGICTYDDLKEIFEKRQILIPLMTRQFCNFENFQVAIQQVRRYADLEQLVDEIGQDLLMKMELNQVFVSYLRDDQVILRKFYTHVDLSRKKDKLQQNTECKELNHISRVWSTICKRKKHSK